MIKTSLEQLVAFAAPYECYICGRENFMLCPECQEIKMDLLESRCYICNKLTRQHTVCSSCRSRSRLRRVWWLGRYEETLKELVSLLKYGRRRGYGDAFGRILSERLPFLPSDTLVVGIPTASSRIRRRGFDQALRIAGCFAQSRGLRLGAPLLRTSQVDQIGKNRRERAQQMQGSFQVIGHQPIQGASILLVDDVITTGATLEAAAALLRDYGAAHVDAAIVARHLPS